MATVELLKRRQVEVDSYRVRAVMLVAAVREYTDLKGIWANDREEKGTGLMPVFYLPIIRATQEEFGEMVIGNIIENLFLSHSGA